MIIINITITQHTSTPPSSDPHPHPTYPTLMITLHPSAPASRTAHPRHPLLPRLTSASHPISAHTARAKISASDPKRRARDSRCIFSVADPGSGVSGEVGVDCGVGDRGTLVMQSITRTRGRALWLGVTEGRRAGVFLRREDKDSVRRRRSSVRWMTVKAKNLCRGWPGVH